MTMTIGDLKGIKKDFLICVQNMRYEQYEYDYKQCTQRTSRAIQSVVVSASRLSLLTVPLFESWLTPPCNNRTAEDDSLAF